MEQFRYRDGLDGMCGVTGGGMESGISSCVLAIRVGVNAGCAGITCNGQIEQRNGTWIIVESKF